MTLQKNPGAVRRFGRLLKFAAWLQSLPNRMTPPPFRLIQIGSAFWQSRVLHAAARLDLASVLGDEAKTAEELATAVSAHHEAIYRLLRMLAAMGIFAETAPRQFRNNKLSAFLRTDNPNNVRAMILMHNADPMYRPWYEQLEEGIRSGRPPFALTHGAELFEYLDGHPELDVQFGQAMDSVEALTGDSFATDLDWGRFDRVIDIGGSRGRKAVALLRRHPHLHAVVVDRPKVIAGAEDLWRGREPASLLSRLCFQAGDATTAVPAATSAKDIYLLSAVLHGFSDEVALAILQNLAIAIGNTEARVAVLELILPEQGADLTAAAFDMQMFMGTSGRERTQRQWDELIGQSGFRLEERVELRSLGTFLVLRRNRPGQRPTQLLNDSDRPAV